MSRLQDQLDVPTGGFTGASGNRRLFADQTYHFQALRVLNDVAAGGADVTEVLETIGEIHEGDAGGWHDGQGAALREHGLVFTPEWEKPNAAAFDSRIDGVVSFDVCYDLAELARHFVSLARDAATSGVPGVAGLIESVRWTFGLQTQTLDEIVDRLSAYRMANVADRISGDVLVLVGEHDQFIPVAQAAAYIAGLTGARSVETAYYDIASGGAEHCQMGASTLWHETFFDWLLQRFSGHAELRL